MNEVRHVNTEPRITDGLNLSDVSLAIGQFH